MFIQNLLFLNLFKGLLIRYLLFNFQGTRFFRSRGKTNGSLRESVTHSSLRMRLFTLHHRTFVRLSAAVLFRDSFDIISQLFVLVNTFFQFFQKVFSEPRCSLSLSRVSLFIISPLSPFVNTFFPFFDFSILSLSFIHIFSTPLGTYAQSEKEKQTAKNGGTAL